MDDHESDPLREAFDQLKKLKPTGYITLERALHRTGTDEEQEKFRAVFFDHREECQSADSADLDVSMHQIAAMIRADERNAAIDRRWASLSDEQKATLLAISDGAKPLPVFVAPYDRHADNSVAPGGNGKTVSEVAMAEHMANADAREQEKIGSETVLAGIEKDMAELPAEPYDTGAM